MRHHLYLVKWLNFSSKFFTFPKHFDPSTVFGKCIWSSHYINVIQRSKKGQEETTYPKSLGIRLPPLFFSGNFEFQEISGKEILNGAFGLSFNQCCLEAACSPQYCCLLVNYCLILDFKKAISVYIYIFKGYIIAVSVYTANMSIKVLLFKVQFLKYTAFLIDLIIYYYTWAGYWISPKSNTFP